MLTKYTYHPFSCSSSNLDKPLVHPYPPSLHISCPLPSRTQPLGWQLQQQPSLPPQPSLPYLPSSSQLSSVPFPTSILPLPIFPLPTWSPPVLSLALPTSLTISKFFCSASFASLSCFSFVSCMALICQPSCSVAEGIFLRAEDDGGDVDDRKKNNKKFSTCGQHIDVHPAALAMYFWFLATFTKNIQCRHLINGPQHKQEQYTLWQILIRPSAIPVLIGFISFGNRHAV